MPFPDENIEFLQATLAVRKRIILRSGQAQDLLARLRAAEILKDYVGHENTCIRSFLEAGEPPMDSGYRTKFAGKWYQTSPVNEEPKCECGLDEALSNYNKAAGK